MNKQKKNVSCSVKSNFNKKRLSSRQGIRKYNTFFSDNTMTLTVVGYALKPTILNLQILDGCMNILISSATAVEHDLGTVR